MQLSPHYFDGDSYYLFGPDLGGESVSGIECPQKVIVSAVPEPPYTCNSKWKCHSDQHQ